MCYTQVLMNLSFMQSIRKRNNPFWIYSIGNRLRWQQHLQRKAHNVEKRYNNNFITGYQCSRLIIATNTTSITKYKPSVVYEKLKNYYLIFMCLLTPFIVQNYIKVFNSRSRVLRAQHFQAHNNPFTLNKIFFAKIININFICLLVTFIVQNFKKSLKGIQSFEDALYIILGPKLPIYSNQVLF